jgi:hypothetical protein
VPKSLVEHDRQPAGNAELGSHINSRRRPSQSPKAHRWCRCNCAAGLQFTDRPPRDLVGVNAAARIASAETGQYGNSDPSIGAHTCSSL